MRYCIFTFVFLGAFLCTTHSWAQTFSPITLTGYNQDVVAEAGTSALTTTTMALDGVPASNKVMYTQAFRTNVGFSGGGLVNNGTIVNGTSTYQLAPYNGNNCFLIQRGQNRDVSLATSGSYSRVRLLGFTTEGTSLLNITLFFTDGSSTTALTNYSLGDWFNNTTNLVLSGFGRCSRTTPATGADGFSTNPRMYYIDIPLSCANAQKSLQRINVSNVTTAGNNAPYPNAVIMALSGVANTPTTSSMATVNATCTNGGSATVTVTGQSPFTISWNTNPVQTGVTASNLAVGSYTATITNANGCVSTANATIGLTNTLTIGPRADTTICSGSSFSPNLTSNGASFAWTPTTGVSNASTLNPTLSPSSTTQYTVTGTLNSCTATRSFQVNVVQGVTVNAGPNFTILAGQSQQLQASGTAGTYLWTPATGLSAANVLNPIATPAITTTYTLRITTAQGCTNTDDMVVTVVPYCVKPLNAFTPNGDGINDRWLITNGNCIIKATAQVYNRYGSKVFESNDYRNTWDGTYKGKPLPDGTYYYKLEYLLINNQTVFAQGDVTILR